MSATISCPACSATLRRTEAMEPGVSIQCPKCEHIFIAPQWDGESSPRIRTREREEMPPRRADEEFPVEPTTQRLICPTCAARLQRTAAMEPGVSIECPKCESVFVAPEYGGEAPTTFTDRRGPGTAPRRAVPSESPRDRRPRENYGPHWKPDVGEWFRIAGQAWTTLLGPSIGYLLLAAIILIPLTLTVAFLPLLIVGPGRADQETAIGIVLLQNFVLNPLVNLIGFFFGAGVFRVALLELRGRDWSFGDFFGGFSYALPLTGWWFIQQGVSLLFLGPALIGIITLPLFMRDQIEFIWIPIVIGAVYTLLMLVALVYLFSRWFFVVPLILDRNMGTLEAMRTSWGMSKGHVLNLFVASLLFGMVLLAGYLLCAVGLLFSISYAVLFYCAAYLEALYPRRATAYED